ncbi:hypothetical protein ABC502_03035 [Alkalimonas sp. NCh-2]|uniref:hypothetical protein n=1 Tax=Alkalimonas sp. NCh-2 TaxID=3144846 RepID=UPI0031F6FB7F
MVLLRAFVVAVNEKQANELAREYISLLYEICNFKVRVVQPYWKVNGQYEILLECDEGSDKLNVIDRFLSFNISGDISVSDSELIINDPEGDFFLKGATWVHLETF